MEGRCYKHAFEPAEAACRNCGIPHCNECLVYAFGPKKPPYCVPCALAASGVRSNAGNPHISKRELKRREKEARRAAKLARKHGKEQPAPEPDVTIDGVELVDVAAPPTQPAPPAEDPDNPFAWADAQDGERVPF